MNFVYRCLLLLFSFCLTLTYALCQCSPAQGLPSSADVFNTGRSLGGAGLPAGATDGTWSVAEDNITGVYKPAVVMDSLPAIFYKSSRQDANWISYKSSGIHSVDKDFFYKMTFNLPCSTLCGKSYSADGAYCLSLDLFSDNSIFEIYVNGVAQSGNLGNIPLANPYRPVGFDPGDKISVLLCHNWKEGANTLIIQVSSSPTISGLLVIAATAQPPTITTETNASICEGELYAFGGQQLKSTGTYFHTFPKTGGCDSTVKFNLTVKPKSNLRIDTSICEGQSYLGYSQTGVYADRFLSAQGCDSIRRLYLTVQNKPRLSFADPTAFCKGDSITLYPGKFDSYLWQDLSVKDHYVVKAPGVISLEVSNNCGTDKAGTLAVEKDCGVYFPTAFTPNDDGKNDLFKVLTEFSFQSFELSIYNRWGEKVFGTKDPRQGWNGQFKGRLQANGVFAWCCNYQKSGTYTTTKGNVVLIR